MNINELPPELLVHVFSFVRSLLGACGRRALMLVQLRRRRHLSQCMLVCKQWLHAASDLSIWSAVLEKQLRYVTSMTCKSTSPTFMSFISAHVGGSDSRAHENASNGRSTPLSYHWNELLLVMAHLKSLPLSVCAQLVRWPEERFHAALNSSSSSPSRLPIPQHSAPVSIDCYPVALASSSSSSVSWAGIGRG